MLAIFDGRVAKRPDCMKIPHKNAVSALKDDFLVTQFTSLYPDSVVVRSESSFTFAYSLAASPSPDHDRYRLAHTDDMFCLHQGFIKDFDSVKHDFKLSEFDDEGIVMIRILKIFRRLNQKISRNAVELLSRNCVSVFFEIPSKLVVLAAGSDSDHRIYWGIDARFSLVVSSNENVVEMACGSVQTFLNGHVYACCKGRTGREALLSNTQLRHSVDFTDKYFPVHRPIEAMTKMILQTAKDRTTPLAEKWEPPLPTFFKINTDAVKFKDGKLGIGWVIRNSKGDVQIAATRKTENKFPDLAPELQALMEGFSLVVGLEVPRCIFESNCQNLENIDANRLSEMVETAVEKVDWRVEERVSEIGVSFVSEGANRAAHRLAVHAKTSEHVSWRKETPECIAAIVESERPGTGDVYTTLSRLLEELDI